MLGSIKAVLRGPRAGQAWVMTSQITNVPPAGPRPPHPALGPQPPPASFLAPLGTSWHSGASGQAHSRAPWPGLGPPCPSPAAQVPLQPEAHRQERGVEPGPAPLRPPRGVGLLGLSPTPDDPANEGDGLSGMFTLAGGGKLWLVLPPPLSSPSSRGATAQALGPGGDGGPAV